MTTTAHEDQFAPEPVDINAEAIRNAALEEAALAIMPECHPVLDEFDDIYDRSRLAAAEIIRALKTPPHNAVASIYKNIRGHRGVE